MLLDISFLVDKYDLWFGFEFVGAAVLSAVRKRRKFDGRGSMVAIGNAATGGKRLRRFEDRKSWCVSSRLR